jgi:hypothetical protein
MWDSAMGARRSRRAADWMHAHAYVGPEPKNQNIHLQDMALFCFAHQRD